MTTDVIANEKEFLFVEKYRPLDVESCILPDRIKNLARNLIAQGEINNMMFYGTGGTGKAQPLTSKVKVPNGWKQMGDITVGDVVCSPSGGVANVIGVFPQGSIDVFKLTFSDGRSTEACGDHLWNVWNDSDQKWSVKDTNYIITNLKNNNRKRLSVELISGDVFSSNESIPIDPYVFGALLGDGSFYDKSSIKFSTADVEMIDIMSERLIDGYMLAKIPSSKYDYRLVRTNKTNKGIVSRNGVFRNKYNEIITSFGLSQKPSHEKFIPDVFKNASFIDKINLISGLIDTDGHIDKSGSVSISTSSKQLSEDIQYIIRSIGGIAKITSKTPTYTYKGEKKTGRVSYTVRIRVPDPSMLCMLPRKRERMTNNYQYTNLKLRIESVEYIGKKESQCIMLDSADHLYITDDFIVTHNTTLACALVNDVGSDILVINCSNENGIDTIRTKLTQFASSVSLAGKPKIAVLDEADGLTIDAQRSLRNFIEQYSKNCRFIFTCNFKNKLIDPLHSRLAPIDFSLSKEEKSKVVVQFFKRVCEILTLESYTFEKPVVAKIIEKNFPDFRRTLGELQKFGIQNNHSIDSSILKSVGEIEFSELFDALKTKDFKKMRSWVVANIENDVHVIYRKLFDSLNTVCSPNCIPNMILLLADYSYKAAFVQDQEINLVACLTEMMASGEWV